MPHISDISQYLSFSYSLSMITSRSVHTDANGTISLFVRLSIIRRVNLCCLSIYCCLGPGSGMLCVHSYLRYETAYKYPGLAFTTDLLFTFLGMRKRWASVWTPANSLFVFLTQGIRGLQVQFSSVAQSCPTLCDPMNHSTPGLPPITISRSSLRLTSIESVMPSSHLILCRPLLLPPSIFPSIRVFSNESALQIRWPKYWSLSFKISPSNEHLGLISFRMDWLDPSAVQGTLESLLQHHSSKASILWCSAFFTVQLSHP